LARQGYPATPAAGNRATGRPIGSPGPSAGAGGTGRHGFLAAGPDSCYCSCSSPRSAPTDWGTTDAPKHRDRALATDPLAQSNGPSGRFPMTFFRFPASNTSWITSRQKMGRSLRTYSACRPRGRRMRAHI